MIIRTHSAFRANFAITTDLDTSGYEEWPVEKVRSGGFDGSTIGTRLQVPADFSSLSFPIDITCNNFALDLSPPTDEYDWYVSQRTDDPDGQALSVEDFALQSSGRLVLNLTALGADTYPTIDTDAIINIFRNVYVYVRRRSDGAIQWASLIDSLFSDT